MEAPQSWIRSRRACWQPRPPARPPRSEGPARSPARWMSALCSCRHSCRDGGARFVEVEEPAVQAAILVEIATGNLEPSGSGEAACLQRLEPGGTNQSFDRRRSRIVVTGVEEHGQLRSAVWRARESVRAERAERLYIVCACGKQSCHD